MADPSTPETRTRRSIFRRFLVNLAVIGIVAVSVKTAVAEAYIATTDAVEPAVPQGARLVVYKLATKYETGDVVAYRDGDHVYLGRVAEVDRAAGQIVLARNGEPDRRMPTTDLIGRAVLNTR